MEAITMYKTSDGRMFENPSEAEIHEKELNCISQLEELVYSSELLYSQKMREAAIDFLIENRGNIYNILDEDN